jgi:hypothetical protein
MSQQQAVQPQQQTISGQIQQQKPMIAQQPGQLTPQPQQQLTPQQPQPMQTFGQQPMQISQQQGGQRIKTLSSQIMSQRFPAETEQEIIQESNNITSAFQFFPVTSCEVNF